jgi:crotonobetainyl-CoA:carnitine CoA-transferase CaiB-like acyl-CoA transferase
MAAAPLQGLRVLDLSKVLAGPLCAQYLGDMGAEVIKVEALEGGDETRHWPPFRADLAGGPADDAPVAEGAPRGRTGTVFLSANRNKRSLAVDLRSRTGLAVVHRLARQADVVIESFGPGAAARLGVDAATLRALEPRLVCCSISGFGNVGPMREGKGYDVILQAFCGMLAITGERDGPPVRSPFSPVDQATGLHALIGILAALQQRARIGVGSTVEVSLFDSATGFLGYFLQGYWERGTEPQRPGSGHESLCPYEAFDTADKPLILGVANDSLWRAFCKVAGLQDVVDDERFATNAARVAHRETTVALVREALARRTRDQWIAELGAVGIPCSPLHTLGELAAHPHTRASGMVFDYDDPSRGPLHGVAQPVRFDGARLPLRRPPPRHGEHGRDILREAGFSGDEIERMAAEGVIR